MLKIVLKWIAVVFFIGLIPVAMLGASQGGIALSPLIIVGSVLAGSVIGLIHCSIKAIVSGPKKSRLQVIPLTIAICAFSIWLVTKDPSCSQTEDMAYLEVYARLATKKLDEKFLHAPKFDKSSCSFSFLYDGPEGKYEFLYTMYGEIHTWDYAQGEL